MEPECVLVCWVIEVTTIDAVPQSDIGVHLGGDKLRQPTHGSHGLRALQPEQQMFLKIGLDWLQELNLILVHNDPDDSHVHVQIAHHLPASHHLGNRVVAHFCV